MEGASGSWNPSSLTRRWRMGPRPAGERVGFGRREYRAGDKKRQRSVHLLRSRSITPRRGCFAKRGTAALEGELPMVECDRSCGLDVHRARTWGRIARNGGLAWSSHSRRLRLSRIQGREGFGRIVRGLSRGAKRSATRQDDRCDEDAAQAANTAHAREVERLGGCSGIESVAEVGERHSACTCRGEPRGKPSSRWLAKTRRPILDEKGRGAFATRVSRDSTRRNGKTIFSELSRSVEMIESQSDGRRPGLQASAHLTRVTMKVVLARRKRLCRPDERRECMAANARVGLLR